MSEIIKHRMTAETEDDFVVFLIGMRINSFWRIHQWLPVFLSMPKMLTELYTKPEMGFISHQQWFGRTTIMVQYWRSFEQLENFASNKNSSHLPAWANFNKKIKNNGSVGIWHETYLSGPGRYETIYNNMPAFGLAKAMHSVPAKGRYQSANGRVQSD